MGGEGGSLHSLSASYLRHERRIFRPVVYVAIHTVVALLPDVITEIGGDDNSALLVTYAAQIARDVIRLPNSGGVGWRGSAVERDVFTCTTGE